MALNNCSTLGFVYGNTNSFCLPVGVDVKQDEFTFDGAWIAGSFFLGLIIGAGIILLLAKLFLAAWRKKKGGNNLLTSMSRQGGLVETEAANDNVNNHSTKKTPSDKEGKISVKVSRFWRRKKRPVTQKDKEQKARAEDLDPALAHGMVNIMLQTSGWESEMAMAEQDMAAVMSMERSIEEETSTMMIHILSKLLRKKAKKRAITNDFFHNFMKKSEEDIQEMGNMIDREREEDEEKLRNDQRLHKDTQALETELQKLQSHYNNKHSKLQRDFRNKIRQDLLRLSDMSEEEINDIMTKLINNMAVVEGKIGMEQARQRRALEQRLAKRKYVLECIEEEITENQQNIDTRVEKFRNLLPVQMEGSSKIEKHLDVIVNDYANDLDGIRKYQAKDYNELSKKKHDLLLESRLTSFSKLVKKQEKERAAFLQRESQTENTIDFIKSCHDLTTKHHMEREALCEELDQNEAEEMLRLKQDFAEKENKEMDSMTEKAAEKLKKETNLMSSEVKNIIGLHKAEMEKYNAKKQTERQAMLARLKERMQQRLNNADNEEAHYEKEQEMLKEEQRATLAKVLTTNMDLTEEEKEKVLNEYEQNMHALSNQLLCSRLRHKKSLEIKLNQRKVQLEKLNLKKRDLQRSKDVKEEDKKNQINNISAAIVKEEELLEKARQAAVAELRKQLAKETEEALKLQDEGISLLIGRLQVSNARKKAILEKQNKNIQLLEEQLDKTLASGDPLPSSQINEILSQHNINVKRLSEQLRLQKNEKEKRIIEKQQVKKRNWKQQIETQLNENAKSEYSEQQKKRAGYTSQKLMQLFYEQKHARAMAKLDAENVAELEKRKSDLNFELQLELQKELEIRKQDLITQIVAVSKMSKKELQDAVSAVFSANTNSKGALQLAKDLRDNVVKAKTFEDGDADDLDNF